MRWSPTEDAVIVTMADEGYSASSIADSLSTGRTTAAVELRLHRLRKKGLGPRSRANERGRRSPTWPRLEPLSSDSPTINPQPSMRAIIRAVSAAFDVGAEDIQSDRRDHRSVVPRHAVMYLGRKLTSYSLPVIGRALNGRDHTTVLHGCRNVEKRIVSDPSFARKLEKIEAGVKALTERQFSVDELAKRVSASPEAAGALSTGAVLRLAGGVLRQAEEIASLRSRLDAAMQAGTKKFRVVPAHIIDRDFTPLSPQQAKRPISESQATKPGVDSRS